MMKDPVNFHRGKPHHVFAFQIIPMFCSLLFLLILSSSSVVGFSYLKAHSLSMKHLMLGSTGAFLQQHFQKKKKSHLFFALYQGVFWGQFWSSVVCISCSVQQLQYFGKMNHVCRCLLNKCRFCTIARQIFLC